MKFLFVCPSLEPLGDAYPMRIVARRLVDAGHEVHVAILHGQPSQSADLESAGTTRDAERGKSN